MATRPVRIANCSGFYGDRLGAVRELLDGPEPFDVLTGDYLAELTMLILWKLRRRDPDAGFATTFERQMHGTLLELLDRGVRVVTNAGGLNPEGLKRRLEAIAQGWPRPPRIAVVHGDDVTAVLSDLAARGEVRHLDGDGPVRPDDVAGVATANAYLGGFGIAAALAAGADIVLTGRVTDASLVVGPAAWWHGWTPDDLDALAGAVVAGHVIECGAQATGGNYPFLEELDDGLPGFPICEVAADGSFVVTKQPGTGGAVTAGTVTAQLLYEIGSPRYENPDVAADFSSFSLCEVGRDRVEVTGTTGLVPTEELKVACNLDAGYRNTMTMVLTGLDVERKARVAESLLHELLGATADAFDRVDAQLLRTDHPDATTNAEATALLRITVYGADKDAVGRRFSGAVAELALSSYAGFYTTTPPTDASAYGDYLPLLVSRRHVRHLVTLPDGTQHEVPHAVHAAAPEAPRVPAAPRGPRAWGPTTRRPLGDVVGGRSGDKGGSANVGLWCWSPDAYAWVLEALDEEAFKGLVGEARDLVVRRFALPNLLAVNFVVEGILGKGVASSPRYDPQAKGLAEYVRSRHLDVPDSVVVPRPVRARTG